MKHEICTMGLGSLVASEYCAGAVAGGDSAVVGTGSGKTLVGVVGRILSAVLHILLAEA